MIIIIIIIIIIMTMTMTIMMITFEDRFRQVINNTSSFLLLWRKKHLQTTENDCW